MARGRAAKTELSGAAAALSMEALATPGVRVQLSQPGLGHIPVPYSVCGSGTNPHTLGLYVEAAG